jgi:DNA-binding SARP family transcriptional activator/tetratricopeptide (TPR) repeat protein
VTTRADAAAARFGVLGPLEVRDRNGHLVPFSAAKPRALLSVLLLHPGRAVPVERLTEALWPVRAPRSAAGAVRTYASTVRRLIGAHRRGDPNDGPQLAARPPGYQLDLGPDDLDMLVFDRLTAQARRAAADGAPDTAADLLQQALGLWRGPPLDGVELGPVVESLLTDLTERRLTAIEDWAHARILSGRHVDVLPALRRVGAEHPLRERLVGLSMHALYRAGRQAEALAAFQQLRRALVSELGIEPGPLLQRLHLQILRAEEDLDPLGAAPVPAAASVVGSPAPRQLPAGVAGFVGRLDEVAAIEAAMRPSGAVVAIDGPGGAGKSALAIHCAHRVASHFPDGLLYVDLQGATDGLRPLDPVDVLGRFLRALGASDADPRTLAEAAAMFRAAASGRRLLFLLDNARDSAQVRPLLPAGPAVVVITSRQTLSTLDNAAHVHLAALLADDARQLLANLAGAARVAADAAATDEVVRFCGNLPLALRIAGARLAARPSWPVRALADRLRDAERRLDELQIADLAVRPSFDVGIQALLGSADPVERAAAQALPLLALFDGADVSVPAAAALLAHDEPTTERVLERLVDVRLAEGTPAGRYRLHDLLRLFARELATRLEPDSATAALGRLLAWYAATTWRAFRLLRPADSRSTYAAAFDTDGLALETVDRALEWLEQERGNLIAAVHQSAATDGAVATQLARGLFAFFHVRGYVHDWIDVNETVLAAARRTGDPVGVAFACRDLGAAHEMQGRYPEALSYLERARAEYAAIGDRHGEAACLNGIGIVYDSLGQLPAAATNLSRSYALSRRLGDLHSQGISLNNASQVYVRLGRLERAARCATEALTIFRRTGNRRSQAASLCNLAQVHERLDKLADAATYGERSLAMLQELGDRHGEAELMVHLAVVHRRTGDTGQALTRLTTALSIAERSGAAPVVVACHRELAATWRDLGAPERAATHETAAQQSGRSSST